ncbi:MAG TPA: hypothetical protein VFM45_06765, partial [Anaeromyxobacteraceae bacterium]|nr:hypothetical protein [Anaeromyxobacteraceae bacterium]
MILLELAAQGVRGFAPERGRIGLRPGYNVVAGDGAAMRRLVVALLHPDLPPDPALRADGPGGSVRGGLTLQGDDGVTWRVVRDLGGPCQLQRYDPERQSFRSVQQDPARIAEVLRAAGAPSAERLEVVLGIAAADFPSRQAPGSSGFAGAAPAPVRRLSANPVDARKKLDAARAELAHAHDTEELQGRMDAAQSRLFKLEEMLKSGDQVNERLRAARARVEALAAAEAALSALGDPAARLAAAARATSRRDEALARVAAEREASDGTAQGNRWPLLRTPGFVAGAAVGGAALLG